MYKLFALFKKTYVLIIIGLFYIPLFIAALFSFSNAPKRGSMNPKFIYSGQGWRNLLADSDIKKDAITSTFIGVIVATIVTILSLMVVFALWRSKNKFIKGYVVGSYSVPMINPDIITAVILSTTFTSMFGVLSIMDDGIERAIIGHIVITIPFGITIMLPRSDIFNKQLFEASKDLGFGPVKTWFKTYFMHMWGVMFVTFIIALAFSFDDFIVTKMTSKTSTIGTKLYATTKLRPWILALGTIMMTITVAGSIIFSFIIKARKK